MRSPLLALALIAAAAGCGQSTSSPSAAPTQDKPTLSAQTHACDLIQKGALEHTTHLTLEVTSDDTTANHSVCTFSTPDSVAAVSLTLNTGEDQSSTFNEMRNNPTSGETPIPISLGDKAFYLAQAHRLVILRNNTVFQIDLFDPEIKDRQAAAEQIGQVVMTSFG